jgi:hypothetical protein
MQDPRATSQEGRHDQAQLLLFWGRSLWMFCIMRAGG